MQLTYYLVMSSDLREYGKGFLDMGQFRCLLSIASANYSGNWTSDIGPLLITFQILGQEVHKIPGPKMKCTIKNSRLEILVEKISIQLLSHG